MTSRLNPYISFGDTAAAALEFYQSVLGGELTINRFADFGGPAEIADLVMHGQLVTSGGFWLMAADTPPGMERQTIGGITISLSGDDVKDLRGWFAGLAEGGTITMPLEKQMWGDEFGQLVDKFGVSWLFNINGDAVDATEDKA